ncbi:MAG: hypothetical protein ABH829_05925 [archaeon]
MDASTFTASLLISLLLLGLGIMGFVDGCDQKLCCESYFSAVRAKLGGISTCSTENTLGNSRPLSLQMAMLGFFFVVAFSLTHQSTRII